MQRKKLAEVQWASRPPLPLGLLGFIAGGIVILAFFGLVSLVFGPEALRPWPLRAVGFVILGVAVVCVRAFAASRTVGALACTDQGLLLGDRTIPYASIVRIVYATPEALADARTTTTDTHLDIVCSDRTHRLLAIGTRIEDLTIALARVERENTSALVGPRMERAWKST